jgi:hypothetical protein
MAYPKCAKCDGTYFELQDFDPPGKMFKIEILCCSKCGAVIGTTGYLEGISRIDYIWRAVQLIMRHLRIDPSQIG